MYTGFFGRDVNGNNVENDVKDRTKQTHGTYLIHTLGKPGFNASAKGLPRSAVTQLAQKRFNYSINCISCLGFEIYRICHE